MFRRAAWRDRQGVQQDLLATPTTTTREATPVVQQAVPVAQGDQMLGMSMNGYHTCAGG